MSEIKITQEHVEDIFIRSTIEAIKMGEKTTVMHVTLPNDYAIIESSSCVDPENYDHEMGIELCTKRVKDKIWELEGYLLQNTKGLL